MDGGLWEMERIPERIIFPRWYHEVSVVLEGIVQRAWLSTDSEGNGVYWNLRDGRMIEASPDDSWWDI